MGCVPKDATKLAFAPSEQVGSSDQGGEPKLTCRACSVAVASAMQELRAGAAVSLAVSLRDLW